MQNLAPTDLYGIAAPLEEYFKRNLKSEKVRTTEEKVKLPNGKVGHLVTISPPWYRQLVLWACGKPTELCSLSFDGERLTYHISENDKKKVEEVLEKARKKYLFSAVHRALA